MKIAPGELRSSLKKLQQHSRAKKPKKQCTKMEEWLYLAGIMPSLMALLNAERELPA